MTRTRVAPIRGRSRQSTPRNVEVDGELCMTVNLLVGGQPRHLHGGAGAGEGGGPVPVLRRQRRCPDTGRFQATHSPLESPRDQVDAMTTETGWDEQRLREIADETVIDARTGVTTRVYRR